MRHFVDYLPSESLDWCKTCSLLNQSLGSLTLTKLLTDTQPEQNKKPQNNHATELHGDS